MSNHSQEDELREILGEEDWKYSEKPAKIQAYLDTKVREARIDELRRIETNDIGPVYVWTTSDDGETAMLISERLSELTQEQTR